MIKKLIIIKIKIKKILKKVLIIIKQKQRKKKIKKMKI